ncbi:serine/threonine protein kinase [Polyangium jinanense]|uniref:Serine/threonine protein kinase n=1 Tax=Polyangium jinanense TaxID=2829994 RepID=A0A9X4AQH1_9BACT|nr:serine/threonine-protein kinase [Polyangium jinanense]MDC3952727.1 serine/threonine protein kinase [Polyangium jinanense]MDC3980346.1 serine/threonine protein kinase [Polyangium jinanense]
MALQIGQIYGGRFRILRVLGEGKHGPVYEGENVEIHRRVTVEELAPSWFTRPAAALASFAHDARAANGALSPHIDKILDELEISGGTRILVKEPREGVTLRQRMRERGRLDADETSRIGIEVARGLAAAHTVSVVHRALDPESIFLARGHEPRIELVKILDFGVAHITEKQPPDHATPYTAPEQIRTTNEIDARADIYALGVILYECLAGQAPFATSAEDELLFSIVMQDPAPLKRLAPDVDPELATIVHKAMARDPRVRYQRDQDLAQALATFRARRGLGAVPEVALAPHPPRPPSPSMSAPGDDDDDLMIADHGTVIMDRKPHFPTHQAPPTPPPPPAQAQPPPSVRQPPLSGPAPAGLPVLPPAITGVPARPQPQAGRPSQALAPIVGGAAFVIVFVLGALIMLAVRFMQDPIEEAATPAPSASAAPAPSAVLPAVTPVEPVPTSEAVEGSTRIITPPPTSATSTRGTGPTRTAPTTKGTGKRRISDDL